VNIKAVSELQVPVGYQSSRCVQRIGRRFN